jgi:hypothetical protein
MIHSQLHVKRNDFFTGTRTPTTPPDGAVSGLVEQLVEPPIDVQRFDEGRRGDPTSSDIGSP